MSRFFLYLFYRFPAPQNNDPDRRPGQTLLQTAAELPHPEIIAERPDGVLVVSFRVGCYEAIRNILKSWIPCLVILEPGDFREAMLKDVKKWSKWQKSFLK